MRTLAELLNGTLDEAKQVGPLYHFTNYDSAKSIIDGGFKLKIALTPTVTDKSELPDYAKYVSFTRDKNLSSPTISRDVRFTIDGDALSNAYKIEPYADVKSGFGRNKTGKDEAEERVNVIKHNGYVDISKYIRAIDLQYPKLSSAINDPDSEAFYEIIQDLKDNNIPYKIVNNYLKEDMTNEDIDEYDVENEDDIKDFIIFIKEYVQQLSESEINEAEYQGRKVPLGKPMRGDIKKFKVYVKNPKTGKVVKVNFGQKGMNIKKNNPKRRAAFRARHNCANPGPRTKARYWSCRKW